MRSAAALLLLVLATAGCLGGAQARVLAQQEANPFVAGSALPPAAAPAAPATAPAAEASPAPPAAAPTAESPAASPAAGAAVDATADPCACTQTGLSGGKNTSHIGCGQWDIVSGSNRFTCFVNDPARCTQGVALSPSAEFTGAATKECSAAEAQSNLPSISKLIVSTPQLVSFANALRQANLSSIPGEQVTIFAPSNQAFNAAVFSGTVTRDQLQDPTFLRGLVLASIVPQRLTTSDLASAGSVTATDGQQLPVKAQSGGQTIVGRAGIVLPDIQATNGIIHITDGFVALPAGAALAPEAAAPSPQPAAAPVAAPSPKPAPAPESPAMPVPTPPRVPPAPELAPTPSPLPPAPPAVVPTTPERRTPAPAPAPEAEAPPAPSRPATTTVVAAPPSPSPSPSPSPRPSPPPPSPSPPPPPAPSPSPSPPAPSPSPPPPPPSPSPAPVPPLPSPTPASPAAQFSPLPPPAAPVPSPSPLPAASQPSFGTFSPPPAPGTTGLLAGSDLSSQLTGGCACTTTGMSGSVQTGQVGCAPRTDSNFLLPISLCYVQNPATCIASFQSTTYPGAAWKLC